MEKDRYGRIGVDDALLIVIDMQERFQPHIHDIDAANGNCIKLIKGCRELGVPVIVTEQNPKGLGKTIGTVRAALVDYEPFEKTAFSIFEDRAIAEALKNAGRPNLLVCGIEAHVCVIKSALDALSLGYSVHWISDAISSRHESNAEAAARRAVQCGAFSSSAEMALFQLIASSEDPHFKALSRIVR